MLLLCDSLREGVATVSSGPSFWLKTWVYIYAKIVYYFF